MNLANESVIEVFLPEIVFPGEWKFWLGEDGSTWRAFVAPEEGHRVRRSAFYAARRSR